MILPDACLCLRSIACVLPANQQAAQPSWSSCSVPDLGAISVTRHRERAILQLVVRALAAPEASLRRSGYIAADRRWTGGACADWACADWVMRHRILHGLAPSCADSL